MRLLKIAQTQGFVLHQSSFTVVVLVLFFALWCADAARVLQEGSAVDVVEELHVTGRRLSPHNVLDIFRQVGHCHIFTGALHQCASLYVFSIPFQKHTHKRRGLFFTYSLDFSMDMMESRLECMLTWIQNWNGHLQVAFLHFLVCQAADADGASLAFLAPNRCIASGLCIPFSGHSLSTMSRVFNYVSELA